MSEGFWLLDNDTGEQVFYTYEELLELDPEIQEAVFKPVGGFCYPANMFKQMPLAQTPFYIQDWLPVRGKMCLYAPAKAGKSTISIQIARCIANNEPFLGMKTTPGTVLYVQAELAPATLLDKLNGTGRDYSNVLVGTTFSLKLDDTDARKILTTAIDAIKPSVLILDPWYKMLKGDENEARDVIMATDYLDFLIETYHCSIIVIHHAGKDSSRGGRGSSVLEGWVDSNIEMKRISTDEEETLKVKITPKHLRHAALPPQPITAEMVNFEFEVVGQTNTVANQIMIVITEKPTHSITVAEIMEITGASRSGVNKAIELLIRDGKLTRVGRGVYMLAPKEELKDGK